MENFDFDSESLQIKTEAALPTDADLTLVHFTVILDSEQSQDIGKMVIRLTQDDEVSTIYVEICTQVFTIEKEKHSKIDFLTENIWTFTKTAASLELFHDNISLMKTDFQSISEDCRISWTSPVEGVSFHESSSLSFRPARFTCYDQFLDMDILDSYCEQIESSIASNQYECGQEALLQDKDGYFAWITQSVDRNASCWKCQDNSELVENISDEKDDEKTFLIKNSCVGRSA